MNTGNVLRGDGMSRERNGDPALFPQVYCEIFREPLRKPMCPPRLEEMGDQPKSLI